jgi:hypothetical protein
MEVGIVLELFDRSQDTLSSFLPYATHRIENLGNGGRRRSGTPSHIGDGHGHPESPEEAAFRCSRQVLNFVSIVDFEEYYMPQNK